MSTRNTVASTGISFGSALAITISWSKWHSILWAVIHGIFGWFYVVYFWWSRAAR
ncbi:MAG TPA: hypothetical protein VGH59_07685 [Casimicrobiaceae bacterium]